MSKIILGYWNLRGRAEPIRHMLEYAGVALEERRYKLSGAPPNIEGKEWFDVKPTMGLDLPNIPYIIDGDVKMTQGFAIMKYLGKKFGLSPTTAEEIRRCDVVEGATRDLWIAFGMMCYDLKTFEVSKKKFLEETNPAFLEAFRNFLGDFKWVAGDKMTYMDFMLCEVLDCVVTMDPGNLDQNPAVKKYLERFLAIDKIAAYRESKRFMKMSVYGPWAAWGGKNSVQ
ncbi:unnamed protein product [Clavelina lepadiformis]|uniref:glutathione transferase n=1 Tax=Clavelina lepadiformis TaxID=159417 RepID=A0ABP0FKL3_CLALP